MPGCGTVIGRTSGTLQSPEHPTDKKGDYRGNARGKPKSTHCPFSAPWKAGIVLRFCTPGGEDLTLLTVPYCEISLS